MNFNEACSVLQDYNSDPVPRYSDDFPFFTMSMTSIDGVKFSVGLNDYDGYEDFWDDVLEYKKDIAIRRQLGIHYYHNDVKYNRCLLGVDCPGLKYWEERRKNYPINFVDAE